MGGQVGFLFIAFLVLLTISVREVRGSEDLTLETFLDTVAKDERVTAVEYYSDMCGSCKEFAPKWRYLEVAMKTIVAAKVNIDTPDGMKIAIQQKVLEEGIPNVRLYTKKADSIADLESITIHKGEEVEHARHLIIKIKAHVQGLPRRDDGHYLKK